MAEIVVQLNAYVIPDDHLVFKCSPGKTYRFYEVVRDANIVFPDVRGLADLEGNPSEWKDAEVLKVIAADRWDREIESRERNNKPKGGSDAVNATDRRNLTFMKRLFFEAKKGDLVVIPAEGYDKEVLFGELLTDPGELQRTTAKDGEYQGEYIGRPVRWRRRIVKRELPVELIDELHYRAAVFAMGRSRAEDVYRATFGNYVFRQRYVAEFRTTKEKFTPEDFAVVSTWLNGFDYLRHEMEAGNELGLPEQMTFHQMGLERVPDSEAAELRINIQSPGEIFVRSAGPFALALMAMLPLAGCDSAQVVDNRVTIEMRSIGSASSECIEVEDTVNAIVRTMSYRRLEDANCLGRRATGDAGMTTDARLKTPPNERK